MTNPLKLIAESSNLCYVPVKMDTYLSEGQGQGKENKNKNKNKTIPKGRKHELKTSKQTQETWEMWKGGRKDGKNSISHVEKWLFSIQVCVNFRGLLPYISIPLSTWEIMTFTFKVFSPQSFLDGSLYLLISQAVDQGVQHGDHCGVEHGSHVLLGQGTGCGGFQVHEGCRPIK